MSGKLNGECLQFLGVPDMEVINRTPGVNGINEVVGVVTGEDEPTMILELLNQSTKCLLRVLCQVCLLYTSDAADE